MDPSSPHITPSAPAAPARSSASPYTAAPDTAPPDTLAHFAALPLEQLEAWICRMSANLAAAEHDWLVAIAEFDERKGWHSWGVASCAHWLGWHVGLEQRTAREKLRVGHALRRLPHMSRAMAGGQLSYSKVRALSRVATDANEATLVMWALAATSNQVERIVAGYVRSVASSRDRTQQQWTGRSLHHSTNDDGSLTITLRLPADAGVEFLSAVEGFVLLGAPLPDGTREPRAARRADAAVHMARVAHAATHATAHAATHATTHAATPSTPAAPDTPEADTAAPETPAPDAPTSTGAATPPLVTLHVDLHSLLDEPDPAEPDPAEPDPAEPDAAEPWTAHEPDTDESATHRASGTHRQPGTHGGRVCHVDGASGAIPHPVAVSPATALRLLCGADIEALLHRAEHPVGVTDRRALVRGRLRRHVLLRDSTCRFPDCHRAAALDVHHIRHRHHGGTNHTHNLVSLCAYHHRLVHEGGWHIDGNPDGHTLAFVSPGGHRVTAAPAHSPTGNAAAVLARGRTTEDGTSQWSGDRLDLPTAVMCLHQLDGTLDWNGPARATTPETSNDPAPATGPAPADCS
jgi:hypothetical protein